MRAREPSLDNSTAVTRAPSRRGSLISLSRRELSSSRKSSSMRTLRMPASRAEPSREDSRSFRLMAPFQPARAPEKDRHHDKAAKTRTNGRWRYDATTAETITRYAIEFFGIRIISFLRANRAGGRRILQTGVRLSIALSNR